MIEDVTAAAALVLLSLVGIVAAVRLRRARGRHATAVGVLCATVVYSAANVARVADEPTIAAFLRIPGVVLFAFVALRALERR